MVAVARRLAGSVARRWPFDRRDALLWGSVAAVAAGLAGWDWRVAAVLLGVLGLGLWALPFVLLRKGD